MIIFHECLKLSMQTSLVEHDQVIQALAADRADDPPRKSAYAAQSDEAQDRRNVSDHTPGLFDKCTRRAPNRKNELVCGQPQNRPRFQLHRGCSHVRPGSMGSSRNLVVSNPKLETYPRWDLYFFQAVAAALSRQSLSYSSRNRRFVISQRSTFGFITGTMKVNSKRIERCSELL